MDNNTPAGYQPLPQAPQVASNVAQPQAQFQQAMYQQQPPGNGKKSKIVLAIVIAILIIVVSLLAVVAYGRFSKQAGPAEITYWGFWDEGSAISSLIAEYQRDNPDVIINYVKQSPTEYRERLTSAMARGDAPDIFRFHNTWTPMFYLELEPLPETVMTSAEYAETFYPAAVESLSTPEGIAAIPLMYDSLGLFINQDIFTTFSEPVPSLWSEFRQTATNLTVRDSNTEAIRQAGAAMGRVDNVDYWQEIVAMMMLQNNVTMSDPSGVNATDAVRYFLQFRVTDQVWDSTLPESSLAFMSGSQLAMLIAPSMVSEQLKQDNPNLRFRVYPVPQLDKFSENDPNITYATFWAEGVWSGSENSEKAWEFLKFLSSQDSLKRLHQATNEPYPRRDMAGLLINDPYYGATIRLAEDSKTWYAASDTDDGETGLNTQISNAMFNLFTINNISNIESDVTKNMQQYNFDIRTILSRYGLAAPPPPPEE